MAAIDEWMPLAYLMLGWGTFLGLFALPYSRQSLKCLAGYHRPAIPRSTLYITLQRIATGQHGDAEGKILMQRATSAWKAGGCDFCGKALR